MRGIVYAYLIEVWAAIIRRSGSPGGQSRSRGRERAAGDKFALDQLLIPHGCAASRSQARFLVESAFTLTGWKGLFP